MNHLCPWFDIAVNDMDRGITFYTKVLGRKINPESKGGFTMGVFEHKEHEMGGCIYLSKEDSPSTPQKTGPLMYFSVEGRLDAAISETTNLGGKIVAEKMQIGPWGFRAIINDPFGNRLALHSYK